MEYIRVNDESYCSSGVHAECLQLFIRYSRHKNPNNGNKKWVYDILKHANEFLSTGTNPVDQTETLSVINKEAVFHM